MSQLHTPLHDLRVAAPCSSSWERMEGNDQVRFCEACALNVYNLSAMTAQEAEHLVARKEGRLCVRFFQREDGTVLTQDCPRGLIALRRAARRTSLAIGLSLAAMLLLVFSLLGAALGLSRGKKSSPPPTSINSWFNSGGSSGGSEVMGDCIVEPPDAKNPQEPGAKP